MVTETILKPIGKGQITIPLEWRKILGIDKKHVRARLEHNRVIIEPLEIEKPDRDVRLIQLNELNQETIDAIKESEKNYKAGNKNAFLSFEEVFGDV